MVKWKRDVILSVIMIVLGIVLFFYAGTFKTNDIRIEAAQPGTYLQVWIFIMILCSVLLLIRTLRNKPDEVLPIVFGKMQIFTVVAMFLYIFLLNKLGFALDTGILIMVTTTVFHMNGLEEKPKGKDLVVLLLKILLFSVAITAGIYYLFTKVLNARLPVFRLFK